MLWLTPPAVAILCSREHAAMRMNNVACRSVKMLLSKSRCTGIEYWLRWYRLCYLDAGFTWRLIQPQPLNERPETDSTDSNWQSKHAN